MWLSLFMCPPPASSLGHLDGLRSLLNDGNFLCLYASLMAQLVKNLPAMEETGFDPWVGKIPWRRKWQPTPVFLPENSMDRGAWQATLQGLQRVRCDWATNTFAFQEDFRLDGYVRLIFHKRPLYLFIWKKFFFSSSKSCCSPIKILGGLYTCPNK